MDFDGIMKKILIVEDEPVTSMELESELQKWGYQSKLATSGEEAIKIATNEKTDLILMDILLNGEIDGIDAAKIIKEKIDVPIIFLTAYMNEKIVFRAKSILPHNYIVKPFDTHKLKFYIDMALEKHEMEINTKKSEKHYKLLADNVTDVISISNLEGITRYISPSCKTLTGYPAEELVGKEICDFIHPEDLDSVRRTLSSIKDQPFSGKAEFRLLCKDRNYIWVETAGKTILNHETGKIDEIITITRDISERKKAEEKLKKSLDEKEMLLKEIHHRIKNNLTVISSLLGLQSNYVKDGEDREMFQESQNRARAMALIHERLYQSEDLKNINFGNYIQKLAKELLYNYSTEGKIKLVIELDQILIDVNTAIPLGLILNELVSNAIKHAFPDGRTGTIRITLEKYQDDYLILEVSDNGIGFSKDLNIDNIESFGLIIVNTLVNQLDATLEITSHSGTVFRVMFRELIDA
jgi:PAS domain S-box-containing protein